jgi:hypothetical protein
MRSPIVLALALMGCAHATSPNFDGLDAGDARDAISVDDVVVPEGGDAAVQADADYADAALCGTQRCQSGQTCVKDRCVFPCTGTLVPGDYATIQQAVTALAGTDATICLAAQSYTETVSVSASGKTPKSLTIIGASAAVTSVNELDVAPGFSSVTLRGIRTNVLELYAQTTNLDVFACTVGTISTITQATVTIDASQLGAPGKYAMALQAYDQAGGTVKVTNSYIHDTKEGIYVDGMGMKQGMSLSIVNDTFVNDGIALDVVWHSAGGGALALTVANDIFVGSSASAISIDESLLGVVHENNLLFGNASNYAGTATDGPGYVKADPLFDGSTPPAPKAGSPALGNANMSLAPATDYWGHLRNKTTPDIGAVESK